MLIDLGNLPILEGQVKTGDYFGNYNVRVITPYFLEFFTLFSFWFFVIITSMNYEM